MSYVPNPSDPTEPVASRTVESAAREFREIKTVLARSLSFPAADAPSNRGLLPRAADRAGRVLQFNATTGVPEPGPFFPIPVGSVDSQFAIYRPAGAGAVPSTVQQKLREVVSVRDFGAIGDGIADDTAAINAGLAFLATRNGGTLYFPEGNYRTTSTIRIPGANIRLLGTGRRKVYPPAFVASQPNLSTIFGTHSERNLFTIESATPDSLSNFSCESMSFATTETGPIPIAAFGFSCGGFQQYFEFNFCSVHGFTSAFDCYVGTAHTNREMGILKITNCSINRNSWVCRNLGATQWNGFIFENNGAGQNGWSSGTGTIEINAHAASISNNILEGTRNPIILRGTHSPAWVVNNYFELTTGDANIQIAVCHGPVNIYGNFHTNDPGLPTHQVTFRVYVVKSAFINTDGQYWAEGAYRSGLPKITLPNRSRNGMGNCADIFTLTHKYYRLDDVNDVAGAITASPPNTVTHTGLVSGAREINPFTGNVMPVAAFVSGGDSATNRFDHIATVNLAAGQWLVCSFLIKYATFVGAPGPYANWLNMPNGIQDITLDLVNNAVLPHNWYAVTVAYRVSVPVSGSVRLLFWPYGVTAPAGLGALISGNTFSTVNSIEEVKPFIDMAQISRVGSIPTSGNWQRGDILMNSSPAAGQPSGWVCVAPGNPGTWRILSTLPA